MRSRSSSLLVIVSAVTALVASAAIPDRARGGDDHDHELPEAPMAGVPHRVLHFTFDDGPRELVTPRILRALRQYDVKATFFVITRVLENPRRRRRARALLRRIAEEGHAVELHGHHHDDFREMSEEELTEQLRHSARLIEEVTGRGPRLVRPPFGAHDARVDQLLARLGYDQVLWAMAPEPAGVREQEVVVDTFRAQLDEREGSRLPGAVVVLHDSRPWVGDAFPRIMRVVKRRNCQLWLHGAELWDVVPTFEALRPTEEEVEARQAVLREQSRRYCPRYGREYARGPR